MNEIIDFPERKGIDGSGRSPGLTASEVEALNKASGHIVPTPHLEFCIKRREMNVAFQRWLETNPAPDDLQIEIVTTSNVLNTLAGLAKPLPPGAA